MTPYKIEKNIPVHCSARQDVLMTAQQLQVGDSFFVPYADMKPGALRNAIAWFSRRNSKSYTVHQDDSTKGCRIWRTK